MLQLLLKDTDTDNNYDFLWASPLSQRLMNEQSTFEPLNKHPAPAENNRLTVVNIYI